MGYFDYLDSKQKREELTVAVDEHWARISFYISLGVLAFFVMSLIFSFTIHYGVSVWFNVPNFLGVALGIVGIVFDQKTFKSFKKKRQPSPIANMALALNILFILLNIAIIAINFAVLYY